MKIKLFWCEKKRNVRKDYVMDRKNENLKIGKPFLFLSFFEKRLDYTIIDQIVAKKRKDHVK